MILKGLHDLLIVLLETLFGMLPTYNVPPGVGLSVLSAANFVLPLSELALLIAAVGAYAVASLSYAMIMRLVAVIRG